MSPDDIKALRKELRCSAYELGLALQVDSKAVFAWENGDLFPTKKHCDRMQALRAAGPDAFPRPPKPAPRAPPSPLRDERLLQILRKLIAHPDLFQKVFELSGQYEDPQDR